MRIQRIMMRQEELGGFVAADLLFRGNEDTWLICLHGLQSNRQMFKGLLLDSRFACFNIIAFDLVGFGKSSKPADFDYDLFSQVQAVLTALTVQGIKRGIWIGHSLGGMIATLAAREAPSYVTALVSLEGNLALADCGKSAEVASTSFEVFQSQYPNFIQQVEEEGEGGKRRAKWMRLTPDYVFYRSSQSIVKWSSSFELLQEFESSPIPKLLVKGGASQFQSQPQGPSVQVQKIPEASHFIMLDAPEVALAMISSFVVKIS